MADIDGPMLGEEVGVGVLLAVQLLLLLAAGGLGLLAGRGGGSRWLRAALAAALVPAASAGGWALFRCAEARDATTGRLEGRVLGPYLSAERAQNHLDFLRQCQWAGGVMTAVAVAGTGVFIWLGLRGLRASSAVRRA